MAKVKVAKISEVPEGDLKKVEANGEEIALYKVGGEVFATTNICNHADCPLDEYHSVEGEVVECTCHGSKFNVKTGKVVAPPAVEPLKTYQVSVEGDEVLVEV